MNFLIADAMSHSWIFEVGEIAGLREFVARTLLVG